MNRKLVGYFWVINLVVLLVVSYLLAEATGSLLTREIDAAISRPMNGPQPTDQTEPDPADAGDYYRTGDGILARNIFDSVTGPIDPNSTPIAAPLLSEPEERPTMTRCDDSTISLHALVAFRSAALSFASLTVNGETKLVWTGDRLNGRTVSEIHWQHLILEGSSGPCYMRLFDNPHQSPPARQRGTPTKARASINDFENQIKYVNENKHTIKRSLIKTFIANPKELTKGVRIGPHRKKGKLIGFKLKSFPPQHPLTLFGAQKGDILHAVNGTSILDASTAMAFYQQLPSLNALSLSILRNGQPKTLQIDINGE